MTTLARSPRKSGLPPCPSGQRFDTEEAARKAKSSATLVFEHGDCGSWHASSPLRSSGERGRGGSPAGKAPARYTGPDRLTREIVLERDHHACVCCGTSVIGEPYSLQHRKRRSQGGDNSPSNLITVLGTGSTGCHERIDSRRDPADEACGYTVRSWADPAMVPVLVHQADGGAILWPTDDGEWVSVPPDGSGYSATDPGEAS